MNPRDTQEQIGLFRDLPPAVSAAQIAAIRAEAIHARDAAIAAGVKRAFVALGRTLAALGSAIVTWPERRATYESLRSLTDRELADIGLTRGDIARVFEPEFRAPRRAASTNALPSARPQAA